MDNKAYKYAKWCIRSKFVPKYVKKQCKEFIKIANGKEKKYYLNEEKISQIENILKLLIMPKGLKAGKTLYECTSNYQWLFFISILAIVRRDNPDKRKYETALLEIARKNFKTYTIATLFILLMIMEPRYSKFYSVAPDGSLSREVKTAIEETLRASPMIYLHRDEPRFKLLRDSIEFLLKGNKYFPLNYSNSRMDGKLPNVFLADEVGALPNSYAIEAMRSGQLNILNKLGCIISTKYPTINNPFEDEVAYAKRVLDKLEKDETIFALLYEPDDTKNWTTDDLILKQANPVALEIPEIWEDLLKKRARAIAIESSRENFLTKHCNIIYQGMGTESYVDVNDLMQCKVSHIDWKDREVYLGVDLSMSNDNCAVGMVAEDEGKILGEAISFIPEDRIDEKTQYEKVNYRNFIKAMKCIACGHKTVDYAVIEDYVFHIEEKYGVKVKALGYDKWNALSSAQKWENGDNGKYEAINCIQIRQHSDTLHPPTKLLYEKIVNKEFQYEDNKLLEINFENARCTYDTNMNRYVTKKKSTGKVDMVVALINACYLLQQDIIFEDGFIVQVF
ncbi:MAG: terminase [Bacilli bacterium]|nr:terminase [Bacilli bacterium]